MIDYLILSVSCCLLLLLAVETATSAHHRTLIIFPFIFCTAIEGRMSQFESKRHEKSQNEDAAVQSMLVRNVYIVSMRVEDLLFLCHCVLKF
jgi:hypothetical protein